MAAAAAHRDAVRVQVQQAQPAVDLQRLRERLGTLVGNQIEVEIELAQLRVDLECFSKSLGAFVRAVVRRKGEELKRAVLVQRSRQRNDPSVVDAVVMQVQPLEL